MIIENGGQVEEFKFCQPPDINEGDYPHFEGHNEWTSSWEGWYKLEDYYIVMDIVDGIAWLAIINLGDKKINVLSPIMKFLERVLEYYNIGFCWDIGYKSEVLINRLSRNFKTMKKWRDTTQKYIVLGGNK